MTCHAEDCRNWTGMGCVCEFLDLEPDLVEQDTWLGGGEGK